MKLFCAVCEKEVTDNIAVYENVDGILVHCGECNYPLMFVDYNEPGWFGNPMPDVDCSEGSCCDSCRDQMDLFDDTESSSDDLECESEVTQKLVFTSDDLDLMEKALAAKVNITESLLDKYIGLLDKIKTLQELRKWK